MRYSIVFKMRSSITIKKKQEKHVQSYCKLILGRLISLTLFRCPQCAEVQYHITNAKKKFVLNMLHSLARNTPLISLFFSHVTLNMR